MSSSAMISPLQDEMPKHVASKCLCFLLSCTTSSHCPQYCCSSSLHFFRCLPRFLLPPKGVQTISVVLRLLSVLWLMCPAHFHFLFLIISIKSIQGDWSSCTEHKRLWKWYQQERSPCLRKHEELSRPNIVLCCRAGGWFSCQREWEPCSGLPACCGDLDCYWKNGPSIFKKGVCVNCIKEGDKCWKSSQCCGSLSCANTMLTLHGICR